MAEYIERESLINHVEDLPTWGADGNLLDREDVIGSIENRLAADVVPVRKGRWESVGLSSLKCSDCGYLDDMKMYHRYCPDCGCFMR